MYEAQKYYSNSPGLKEAGYSYVDDGKVFDIMEFHINDCEDLIYLIKVTHHGGFLNVRFPEGQIPVINIGHDECIFNKLIVYNFVNESLWGNFIVP